MIRLVAFFLVLFSTIAQAQWQVPQGQVPIGRGPGFTGFSSSSVWTNVASIVTTTYSTVSADCGKTIALTGNFYSVTINAASGYLSTCVQVLRNESTTRGKRINVSGATPATFILWPLQTAIVYSRNNVWIIDKPARWKHWGGTLNVFAEPGVGLDTNDCLATGSGNSCATLSQAMYMLCDNLDFAGTASAPTRAVVNLTGIDTGGVHWSCNSIPGTQGGSAIVIFGQTGAQIAAVGADAIGCFINTTIQVDGDIIISSTTGHAVTAQLGARIYLLSPSIKFSSTTFGAHIYAANPGSVIYLPTAGYQILGGAAEHYLASDGGSIASTAVASSTAVFTGSIAATTLTVTAVTSGTITQRMYLTGSGVTVGTQVGSQLTGTPGGIGTYALTIAQAVGSTTLTGTLYPPVTWGVNSSFSFFALAANGSRISVPGYDYNCNTFACGATKYLVSNLSEIVVSGRGVNYFPGGIAGSADGASGGYYN
jgi:hypothetical protein